MPASGTPRTDPAPARTPPGTLAVLGATGRTGRRVVQYALADGFAVRALARVPAALANPRLAVIAGDAADAASRSRTWPTSFSASCRHRGS